MKKWTRRAVMLTCTFVLAVGVLSACGPLGDEDVAYFQNKVTRDSKLQVSIEINQAAFKQSGDLSWDAMQIDEFRSIEAQTIVKVKNLVPEHEELHVQPPGDFGELFGGLPASPDPLVERLAAMEIFFAVSAIQYFKTCNGHARRRRIWRG